MLLYTFDLLLLVNCQCVWE